MNDKVREFYKTTNLGAITTKKNNRTIGDVFYENLERQVRRDKKRRQMIKKYNENNFGKT